MPSVADSRSRSPPATIAGKDVQLKRKRVSRGESRSGGDEDAGSNSSSGSSARSSRSPTPQRQRRRRRSSASSSSSSSSASGPARNGNGREKGTLAHDADEDLARREAKGQEIRSELAKLANTRAGGAYVPPAKLRALMAEAAAADSGSVEYQRMSWDALKKSITGLVNKVAAENIKFIVPELFGGANLIRGRGLFCRSIMKAQMQSLAFTPVFAALAAIVNTKLPMVGELLAIRLVSQFRRSFKRDDKVVCNATAMFIAHLVNQRMVHEILALEMLVLLLEKPSDDSVEVAVGFMREVGAFLAEEAPKANNSIFDRFRAVLYEGDISKRVQYMIEVLSQVRREKYKDNPRIPEMLDLVEEDDQITHEIGLDDNLNVQETLNVFRADPDFVENEDKYREIKNEILGEGSDEDEESGSDASSEESAGEEDEADVQMKVEIQDKTETNLVNLRRTIYLTIMSSAAFEEAVHKLMRLSIPEGQEIELCNMVIECCSQERTFTKFYGLIGERLCKLRRTLSECYELCFRNYYDSIHRYETNRLRNIARFFGWIIAADGISWACFTAVHMTEEDTTSSSRIFIKILMTEMKERLGMKGLVERFNEPSMQEAYVNMMPRNDPKATRFSINFFTSIGVPQLTDGMREHLKKVREEALAKAQLQDDSSSSDSSSDISSSSISSSSLSDSYSDSDSYYSRSPPPRRRQSRDRRRSYSYSRSRSPAPAAPARRRPARDAFSPDREVPEHDRSNPAVARSERRRSLSRDSRSPRQSRPAYSRRTPSLTPSQRPPRRNGHRRDRSLTPLSRSHSRSLTPPPRRRQRSPYSRSISRSPISRRRARSRSYDSRSPSPVRSSAAAAPRQRQERGRARSRSYDSRSFSSRSPTPPSPRNSRGGQSKRQASRSPSYSPLPSSRRDGSKR